MRYYKNKMIEAHKEWEKATDEGRLGDASKSMAKHNDYQELEQQRIKANK